MATKRQQRITQKIKENIQAILKEKLAELILLREDLEMQDKFATELAEKKEIIQQIIIVNHQIQALQTVIGLFVEGE